MEIERKFLLDRPPEGLEQYPRRHIEQAYLCTDPALRVRRSGDGFFLMEGIHLPNRGDAAGF